MRSLAITIALVAATLVACEDAPRPEVIVPVSIDIIVEGDVARIYVRPLDRDCRCTAEPLLFETCGQVFTDRIFCSCGDEPATSADIYGCARELRLGDNVVSDDVLLGEVAGSIGDDDALTIVGCGDDLIIPLRDVAPPSAGSASDLRRIDDDHADALVDVDGASQARLCSNNFFTGDCCGAEPGRVPLPPALRRGCESQLTIETLAGPATTNAPSGVVVRVWARTTTTLEDRLSGIPVPRDDGRWQADVCLGGALSFTGVVFDPLDDTRFTLVDEAGSELELARDADTLRVRTTDEKVYVATIAHDPIDRRLPIGTFDALAIDVDHGDVVLANVDDAADTITITVGVNGAIGGIPRP